ncbi:MAG: 50S ribosomal protein L9 [Lachnospiraceae bacterium]|nr:50S ribosomal protein L9 [Lachnospiraceae bacterium]MBQ8260971.1 50S ribosomal protein L9 [Lachnospiraceae bacterium]
MKVILHADVKNVGKKGDIVELSDGYARNCIISKKLGVEATPANLNNLKLKKANDDKIAQEQLAQAQQFAKDLESVVVALTIKQGEGGKTFGAISSKEIASAAKQQHNLDLDKKKIMLKEPIKYAGEFKVPIKLHPQVTGTFTVKVAEE